MTDDQSSALASQIDVGQASCLPVLRASCTQSNVRLEAAPTGRPEACPALSALTGFQGPKIKVNKTK